jgi:hypothetical protein
VANVATAVAEVEVGGDLVLGLSPSLRNYAVDQLQKYRCRYRCRNRFGGTYTTYETDRTNESVAKIARDGVSVARKELHRGPGLKSLPLRLP